MACVTFRRFVVISCRSRCAKLCAKQTYMSGLDLLTRRHIGEVDERTGEFELRGDRAHAGAATDAVTGCAAKVRRPGSVSFDMTLLCSKVGAEVGQNLARRRFQAARPSTASGIASAAASSSRWL